MERQREAGCGHRADFGECLLLGVEPPWGWSHQFTRGFRFSATLFWWAASGRNQNIAGHRRNPPAGSHPFGMKGIIVIVVMKVTLEPKRQESLLRA